MRPTDWRPIVVMAALTVVIAGCAEGPLYQTGGLFPWSREQWIKDEAYGPTIHARREELTAIRSGAARLSAAESETTAQQLVAQYDKETNALVRVELMLTIGALPGPTAVSFLQARQVDENNRIREECCQLWGKRARAGNSVPEAVAVLTKAAASDADTQVRMAALREMAELPAPEVQTTLTAALDDDDPAIQHRAMRSLALRTGKDFGNDTRKWKDHLAGKAVAQAQNSWTDPLGLFR